jgi:hypothetical protein
MSGDTVRRVLPLTFGVAGVVLVLTMPLAILGWINGRPLGVRRADITMVQMQPVSEGSPAPPFSRTGQRGTYPLSKIEGFIPEPLPHSVWQGFPCHNGGDLVITLTDGRTITYGPCRYPRSIYVLWGQMIDVESGGSCRPNCGPGGSSDP